MTEEKAIEGSEEVQVTWESQETGETTVTASLGTAQIVVSYDEESVDLAPVLVGGLPNIMNAVMEAMASEQQEEA